MKTPFYQKDPYLTPYIKTIEERIARFDQFLKNNVKSKTISEFSNHHFNVGLFKNSREFIYREWAPGADALFLVGDFNNWNDRSHSLTQLKDGLWEIKIPLSEPYPEHESKLKVCIKKNDTKLMRLPSTARFTYQDPETFDFCAVQWDPHKAYQWKNKYESHQKTPLIYECHIGIATEEEKVGQYNEFKKNILPYIHKCGYNTLQLMAIAEHPYYGSYGYHVSNYFAPSSRFGNPDEFKSLVDAAHALGMNVIIDIVHSHCAKNENEGLNNFDGTSYQYFHEGPKGDHSLWDSKLFDYGKPQIVNFLLSNIRYWIEDFRVDGFRFDGVTSMLYSHHGHYVAFDHYDKYFDESVDNEAVCYLQLANKLIHELNPHAVSIAEDVSGMPGLCSPLAEGGLGFDYRLSMSIPDYWIKLLKEIPDENWPLQQIVHELTNHREEEKTIAYAESHDQALVGDKTISFHLMDKEMYWHMDKNAHNPIIDRGIALHKMIRLITFSLGGNAYLNFMGNEFGHPEWIDFPREGNNFSYKYARRQWSLAQNPELKYADLLAFDTAMIELAQNENLLKDNHFSIINHDEKNQCIAFEKAGFILFFNFHCEHSIPDYLIGCPDPGTYSIILNSDSSSFGGFDRIDTTIEHHSQAVPQHGYEHSLKLYIPNRCALVLKKTLS